MWPTRAQLIAGALGLLAAGLALAACGGSSPSGSAGAAGDSALQFSRCMREHGIKDFPDPETGPGGATRLQFKAEGVGKESQATMEAAQEACRHFQEQGEEGHEPSPQEKVEREEQVQKFAKCMREHGIELEVDTSGGGVAIKVHAGGPHDGGPEAGGGPKRSPAFEAAQEACQGLFPAKGKGGPRPGRRPTGG